VGASGAIFGLYEIFLSLLLNRVYPKEVSKSFLLAMLIFLGFNLLVGVSGGIDNAAHLGGLLSGMLLGLIVSPGLKSNYQQDENNEVLSNAS
jgi:membrane associated rhomboid family serine protease